MTKKQKYTYDEIFQRNIGVFTPEEQERIKNLKVAIAGAGGLGAMAAHLLARLGVGEIRICDPEVFEVSNLNRQVGSYTDTLGKNKALVVASELKRINPGLKIKALDYGIDQENVNAFIDGIDLIIDGIDFYELDAAIILHEAARINKKWIMVSQIAGSISTYLYIRPGGPHFGDLFFDKKGFNYEKMLKSLFPIMPREATPEIIDRIMKGERVAIPSWSHAPVVTGLFLVEDIVSHFIKRECKLVESPKVQVLDIFNKKFFVR